MYDLRLKPEAPVWIAPGARRVEVVERIAADGTVLTPLDMASADAAIDRLVAEGVEAVAVCLLFSFLDPRHERALRDRIHARAPGLAVSISSEVDPAFREYERSVVTAFDAYVKPLVADYIDRMAATLAAAGLRTPVQVMQSRGGLASGRVATQRPVRLLLSGPAAGVLGAQAAAAGAGLDDLITIDVGGTSSDIALVRAGQPLVRAEMNVDGFAVRVPTVDVTALGAGGGSIAWIDGAGGLRVGPHSAGADPGPACYGRGGTAATVTDASVVLGWLDPAYFAGGRLRLDPALAQAAIAERVAGPLGLGLMEAALGIHRVVNAQMADGIRLVSVKRGYDPRDFTLVSLGGGGGLHVADLARELGIARVLVPRFPGVLSAAGLLAAPVEHEMSAALHTDVAAADPAAIARALADLDAALARVMAAESVEGLPQTRHHLADMAYVGQSHSIEVEMPPEGPDRLAALHARFEAAHARINGHATGARSKIVNLRAVHRAHLPPPALGGVTGAEAGRSLKARRRIHLSAAGPVVAEVHDRGALAVGEVLRGPAILEQDDTTTLLPGGWRARVLDCGALLMEREDSA